MGVEAVLEAVDLVAAGTAPQMPQDERLAIYEAPCEKANARLDWGRPVMQLHDLVRGCSPAPGAWTTCGDQALQVLGATPQPARDVAGLGGAMGEVVDVGDDWFSVVCADGRLRGRATESGTTICVRAAQRSQVQSSACRHPWPGVRQDGTRRFLPP